MTTINLLNPAASDIPVTETRFPDGQLHLRVDATALGSLDSTKPMRVLARLTSGDDLLRVLLLKDVLDHAGVERVELCVSYLLAARMDRMMVDGEPFSLRVVAQMLNSAGFRKIFVFDPHSDVTPALLERGYVIPNHRFAADALQHYWFRNPAVPFCLVSPDAGALKKIHALAAALNITDVVACMKERDVRTGKLTGFTTTADNLGSKTCFIVDDICDGGGTFAGTAALLRERGAGKIVLIVSHGIFSKGTAIAGVDAIYTTDSYREVPDVVSLPVVTYMN